MKKFLFPCSLLIIEIVFAPRVFAQEYKFLSPLTQFGPNGNGSLRPGDRSYITTGNSQRGLAFNPATHNLIFIDRAAGSGGSSNISGAIHVLNSLNGEDVGTLSTNGMSGGNFADVAVAVSDDGVVYVGNLVNDGTTSPFKLYRWESDTTLNDPVVAFSGDPGNGRPQRWGDTMDIRGSGPDTQILLGTRNTGNVIGTNVAILTTTDGVNFTATTLVTDVSDSATGGGIAFGAGNTFWAKNLDLPLRQFSFNLAAGTATVLHSYGSDVLAASRTLEPLAVDAANHLLAIVDMNAGVDQVRLYDISNLAVPPALLDTRDFSPVNNANGTTTKGYLDFGADRLYVHNMNNGLLAFSINSTILTPPLISAHPVSQRVLAGRTVRLEVIAYPSATYEWRRNGAIVSGASGSVLLITNAQPADAGTYRVTASNAAGSTDSSDAMVSVVAPEDLFHLEPLWSTAPAAGTYVTSTGGTGTPNERNIAYHSLSNQLLVVQKAQGQQLYAVHVLNASTGVRLYGLRTNGVFLNVPSLGGSTGIGLDGVDVADDGAVYACNETPDACGCANTNGVFRVYRWADSGSNTLPVQVFQGEPTEQTTSFRWGDVMDARGGGLNTQIILDNHNPAAARYMTVLRPFDQTMSTFASTYFFQDLATPFGSTIGRSLEFGIGDTLWQKRRASPLIRSSFDVNAFPPISPVEATHTNLPGTLGAVGLDLSRNLLAGINYVTTSTAPDTLDLYDISDPDNPLLLAQYPFPVINRVTNANFIGRVLFAGNRVFAINGNNGLMAFTIVSGPVSAPTILTHPQNTRVVSGGSATLNVIVGDVAAYQWQREGTNLVGALNSTLVISNAQPSDAGNYRVIVSNDAGSVTSLVAVVTVLPQENFHRLAPLWNAAPGTQDYVTSNGGSQTPNERQIAYNSLSNQLYVVHRTGTGTAVGTYAIYVVDPATGSVLHTLNTNGILHEATVASGNSFLAVNAIDVADDGSIYAATLTPDACVCLPSSVNSHFRVYRWANAHPDTLPVIVFQGEPAGQSTALRWGDVLDVRGAGIATEIIVDNNQGSFAAVLKPTDETLSTFAFSGFGNSYGGGTIGRSLEFGNGNTIWQKRKGTRLQLSSYDLPGQTSTMLTNQETFPASLGPVAVDTARRLIAGLDFAVNSSTPDTINLYDTTDFSNPLLIARYPFPENARPNGNFIGEVLFAGDRVFAVDGNNGIVAFTILPPSGPPLSITPSNSNVILSWSISATNFVLQKTLSLSAPDWMTVSQAPQVMNGQKTVTENASTGNAFYRLRQP